MKYLVNRYDAFQTNFPQKSLIRRFEIYKFLFKKLHDQTRDRALDQT